MPGTASLSAIVPPVACDCERGDCERSKGAPKGGDTAWGWGPPRAFAGQAALEGGFAAETSPEHGTSGATPAGVDRGERGTAEPEGSALRLPRGVTADGAAPVGAQATPVTVAA